MQKQDRLLLVQNKCQRSASSTTCKICTTVKMMSVKPRWSLTRGRKGVKKA
ncbi:unnamed protein product [Amoebophrya sp. A120]|nr:unnamed protein product [Amoebophrya sp. A120]|eukprot:GSA120T00007540001.1